MPDLLAKMSPVDLIVVEGFKREPIRKIEVHRRANGKPPLFPDDPNIVGLITDTDDLHSRLPTVHIDDIKGAADLLQHSATLLEDVPASAGVRV